MIAGWARSSLFPTGRFGLQLAGKPFDVSPLEKPHSTLRADGLQPAGALVIEDRRSRPREHPDLRSGLVANWYHPSHILQIYDAWERLRTCSTASEPVDQHIDRLNGFVVHAGLGLVFLNRRWGIDFEVSHLLDALGIMLINNLTSGRDQIRMCALGDCRRPFLTRDPRANYCCPAHSQRGRVRKHRERQNGKKQAN